MASAAEEALQDSGSATTAGTSQLQQAGRREAAAGGVCTICLDNVDNAAYVDVCFHAFCFDCIPQWAASRAACPLCRRPFDHILHTGMADDDYQEYVVSSSACRQRSTAGQRVRSRSPQRHYHLRPRPTTNEPAAGRRGPAGTDRAAWGTQVQGPPMSPPSRLQGSAWPALSVDLFSASTCWCCKLRLLASWTLNKDPEAFQSMCLSKPLGTLYMSTLNWLWGEV
ncbi:hypothetical protein QYF61_002829 [Mycteria americana]|uniref:RING-type E3 ubiquitin transferase n=1 Tax=Mycteria americana TaxID=33587 RepID=A0AAN7NGV1_MYCAM|nr:hypothetical protein QYF61_002829 [Mycteria americana]